MSTSLLSKLFHFVLLMTKKYDIDESHGMTHSMNVLHFAHNIYNDEVQKLPFIQSHEKIIYVSAILHDMCDKKYINQDSGIKEISTFLEDTHKVLPEEITVVKNIITTMSYSTVKKQGFPGLHDFQTAYHIVREADLLSAYDFDRCMIYHMKVNHGNFKDSFYKAEELFEHRVFRHAEDNLFRTNYALTHYPPLHNQAMDRIKTWKKILDI